MTVRSVVLAMAVVAASSTTAAAQEEAPTYRGTLDAGVVTVEQLDDVTAVGFLVFDGYSEGSDPSEFESGDYVAVRDEFHGGIFEPGAGCEGTGPVMRCEPAQSLRVVLGDGNNYLETHVYDAMYDVTTWMNKPMLVRGGGGNDELEGGFGPDRIYGGPGLDFLYGSRGDDYLHAGGAPRRFTGEVQGGAGDDTIVTTNGRKEKVVCGSGDDTATIDQLDIARGCEHLTRKTIE